MKRSTSVPRAALLFGALAATLSTPCPPAAAGPGPLAAKFVVARPSSKEGGAFTVSFVVTNTGPDTITNVRPTGVAVTGTGAAALAKWPKPATATIRSGRSATFKLHFAASLRGVVEIAAGATSDAGDSPDASSPTIVVAPRKVGAAATTTDRGDASIKVGRFVLPICLRDERTGDPVAGLAVAFAADKKVKSRGVIAVLDPLGRRPPQWFVLSGPPTAPKASGPPAPVDLSMRGPCADDGPFMRVVVPIETTALPAVKPSAAPPSPDVPDAVRDRSPTIVAAFKAALVQAQDAAKAVGGDVLRGAVRSGVVTRETVTCADAWQKDLDAIAGMAPGEFVGLFVDDPRPEIACGLFGAGAGACLGGVATLGTAEKVSQIVDRFRLGSFCPSPSRRDVVERYKLDLHLPPALSFLDYDIYAHIGVSDSYADLFPISAAVTDFSGAPLTSGSLELVSFTDAGLGIVAPLGADGAAAFDVPPGDYRWCANSPGHEPQTGDVVVAGPGATQIHAGLVPLAAKTVEIEADGLTGFLAPGTTRQMTATFRDAQGGVVDCTGRVRWYAVNPVGTIVATVNETTGLVTMQGGCGAALVISTCDGVSSVPGRLFSTDCKGTLPPKPPAVGGGSSALAVSIASASVAYVSSDAGYHYYELTASGTASGPVGADFLVVTYGGHPALATPIPPQYALSGWGDRKRDGGEPGTTTWSYTETLRTSASNPREFYDINVELYVGVTSHPASGDVERHATKTDGLRLN